MSVGSAQTKINGQAATALFEHGVEARRVAVAIKRVENIQPSGGGAFQRAAFKAQGLFGFGAHINIVGGYIPIKDNVASTRECECAAFRV